MADEWPALSLREAGIQLLDCEHRTPPPAEAGYPYVAIPQVKDGRLDLSDARLISHDHFIEWARKACPQQWDVILSRRCNPGETAVVPSGLECALGQNLVLLRADGKGVLPEFLRWLVRSPEWWEQIQTFINVGAVFDSLKCADIPNFRLPIPPLESQRAIAYILGTLDDKIELNRRMNETLEAMARALFKSWFVDFLPVRAKAAARTQTGDPLAAPQSEAARQAGGLPKPLADLFPDSFEDSELGEIPNGWETGPFADTIEILGGGTPKTSSPEYWNGAIPWFSVVDAPSDADVWVIDTEKKITQAGVENSSTRILPVGTTIITARGTVGRIALTGVPMAMNQSCYGLRSRIGTHGSFTYFSARALISRLQQHAHGSVFDTITRETLAGVAVVMPPANLVGAFEEKVAPTLDRIRNSLIESRTLAALRDTLLPKLISGELRVENVGQLLKAPP